MQNDRKSIIIVDANAFISMSNITNLAVNHRLVTTPDVINELRDQKTKQFIQTLPFKLQIVDYDDKDVELVKAFSKKTGDIATLSQIDMELIAVAFRFYKQEGLEEKLRKEPPPILQKEDLEDYAKENEMSDLSESDEEEEEEEQQTNNVEVAKIEEKGEKKAGTEESEWISVPKKPKRKVSSSSSQDDDEEGWITTQNYQKKMAQMVSNFKEEQQQQQFFNIWLMSADFALQNVAVQMGMNLLSLDGRKISSIRRFIYECYLCWKKYRISDQKVRICSGCGYNSLSKVAYSIDATGKMILHRKKGWKPNLKIMQAKQRKFEEQERKKKHQHARRKKEASIFDH